MLREWSGQKWGYKWKKYIPRNCKVTHNGYSHAPQILLRLIQPKNMLLSKNTLLSNEHETRTTEMWYKLAEPLCCIQNKGFSISQWLWDLLFLPTINWKEKHKLVYILGKPHFYSLTQLLWWTLANKTPPIEHLDFAVVQKLGNQLDRSMMIDFEQTLNKGVFCVVNLLLFRAQQQKWFTICIRLPSEVPRHPWHAG